MTQDKSVLVVGVGRVGRLMAEDLAQMSGVEAAVADASEERLKAVRHVSEEKKLHLAIGEEGLEQSLLEQFDFFLLSLPGHLGTRVLEQLVQAGKKVIDISFFADDPRVHHDRAVETGAVVWYDCGVAPGLSNVLVAAGAAAAEKVSGVKIYVGGLPVERTLPLQYKAPFSPTDVLEEYTRPARIVRGGKEVSVPPLTEPELIEVPGVGTLEGFLTDGLRSLADTVQAPEMRELTLRYPGHREQLCLLRDLGFFDSQPLPGLSGGVSPLAVTAELFKRTTLLREGDRDFTYLQVDVAESDGPGEPIRSARMIDFADLEKDQTSMARTTGFTATFFTKKLLDGDLDSPGVFPPEKLIEYPGLTSELIDHLEERVLRFISLPEEWVRSEGDS